jgi:dipeptidase
MEEIMACTTILVGKKATYDGSTMIARNDDSPSGRFNAKKFAVVLPDEQPKTYRSVISHLTVELPENPMRYTAMPNAVEGAGIWAASGVNEENIAMTATETITSNERVTGADPMVEYVPAANDTPEKAGGIGEEDLVVLVLPYIHSAKEGVIRLGELLEKYGTYEMNGIAFQDVNEIWWLETIGGHHWIAKRVPDDQYVIMPNQLGIDEFDFSDALGDKKRYMCSADMKDFVEKNHLDLSLDGRINPRDAFGSHSDADHVYNTPRGWFMAKYLSPDTDGSKYGPESDNIPWSAVPARKVTVEDVKYLLSSHYQGTEYDPYGTYGDASKRGMYRSIGINRNDFMALIQVRPYVKESYRSIEWFSFGSNAFNALVPLYANISETPEYLSNTDSTVDTDNFYWSNRLIGALADASYSKSLSHIENYQFSVQAKGHEIINKYDIILDGENDGDKCRSICEKANQEMSDYLKKQTQITLGDVLYEASCGMKNAYMRSDN